MKILHISHTDITSDSRILKELQSLEKANKEYKLFGIGLGKEDSIDKVNTITIHTINLTTKKFQKLPRFLRHILNYIESFYKATKLSKEIRPDIIHCHDTKMLPIAVLIKLYIKAKRLIYDAHELESDKNGISKLFGKLIFLTEKILWRYIDVLIVVSPSIKKWYIENLGKKEAEVILNAPIVKQSEDIDSNYLREKFNIPQNSKIFLYVGGLVKGRGVETILEVFKKEDISSSLVFLGYGYLEPQLQDIANKYDNIFIHKAVPYDKVVSIVKSADVGLCLIENVSLSYYYSLPNKLFEYAFAGVPILASAFPDIVEVVDRHKLGRYCDLDVNSIYKTVKDIENENLEKIDTKNLYDLSWEVQEQKLIKLYNKVLLGDK